MRLLDAINRFYFAYSLGELRQMNDNTSDPNITYNSMLYLDLIHYKDRCTVSYLAEVLQVSKSAVTSKVNELLVKGLVTKTRSETDRRVFYLSVSPQIREEYASYNAKLRRIAQRLTEQFSEAEVDTFCRMLDMARDSYLEPE